MLYVQVLLGPPTSYPGSVSLHQYDVKGVSCDDPFHLLQNAIQHFVEVQGTADDGGGFLYRANKDLGSVNLGAVADYVQADEDAEDRDWIQGSDCNMGSTRRK